MKPILVGLGEILWDLLPSGKQLGGAPANFVYQANALGGQGVVASSVGTDPLGEEILDRLKGLALDGDYVARDEAHPTGTVSVQIDADGNPSYTIHKDVAWDFIPESAQLKTLARLTHAVCFGSLAQRSPVSRATIHAFLESTPQQALRIFDVNLRQSYYTREILDESLQPANVLKISEEELPVVAKLLGVEGDETTQVKMIGRRYGLGLVAMTRGKRGSLLISATHAATHPGCAVEVVDTVGAGDAFTAALALGMLKKYELSQISDCANRLAAFVCSRPGATPELPPDLRALFAR